MHRVIEVHALRESCECVLRVYILARLKSMKHRLPPTRTNNSTMAPTDNTRALRPSSATQHKVVRKICIKTRLFKLALAATYSNDRPRATAHGRALRATQERDSPAPSPETVKRVDHDLDLLFATIMVQVNRQSELLLSSRAFALAIEQIDRESELLIADRRCHHM